MEKVKERCELLIQLWLAQKAIPQLSMRVQDTEICVCISGDLRELLSQSQHLFPPLLSPPQSLVKLHVMEKRKRKTEGEGKQRKL